MQKTNQESIWHNWPIDSFFAWKNSVYRERICILRLTKGKSRRLSITAAFFDNWVSTRGVPHPGNWLNYFAYRGWRVYRTTRCRGKDELLNDVKASQDNGCTRMGQFQESALPFQGRDSDFSSRALCCLW